MMKSAYQNVGEFISELEKAGELLGIKAPVSCELEITQITDLASKAPGAGKALLFEHVRESRFPVLTNAFGSQHRICMALGTESMESLAQRIERLFRIGPPKSLRQLANLLPIGIELIRSLPRRTSKAACQEVIYSHYFQEYRRAGKRMPVAVAVGTDPAVTYASTAPLPRGLDEMMLAGFIRKRPVPMARCVSVDLEVPAEAEFVFEGYVDPEEVRLEGPFGDHTGYYSPADQYPVFHLTALTHRRYPVYAATSRLPGERERPRPPKGPIPANDVIEKSIRDTSGLLSAFHAPPLDVRNRVLLADFRKDGQTPGRAISEKLLRKRSLKAFSILVLLDSGVDLRDYSTVLWRIFNNVDPKRDILRKDGRVVIDATAKGIEDGHTRPWPSVIEMTPDVIESVKDRAKELGIEEFL